MFIKKWLIFLIVPVLIISLPHHEGGGEEVRYVPHSGTIETDTTWSGNLVFSNVTVAEGAILTISPGSSIYGTPMASLFVEGTLIIGSDGGERVLMDSVTSHPWGLIQVNSTGRVVARNTLFSNVSIAIHCLPGGTIAMYNSTVKTAEVGVSSSGDSTIVGVYFENITEEGIYLSSTDGCILKGITVKGADRGIFVNRSSNLTIDGADISGITTAGIVIEEGGENVLIKDVQVKGNGSNYPTKGVELIGYSKGFKGITFYGFRPSFLGIGMQIRGVGEVHITRSFSIYSGMDLNVTLDGKLIVNKSYINSHGGSYFRHLSSGRCEVYYYDSYADERRIHVEDEWTFFVVLKNITVGARDQSGRRIPFNLTVAPYGGDPIFEGFIDDQIKLYLPFFSKEGATLLRYQPYNFTFTSGRGFLHVTIETAGVNWKKNRYYATINLPPLFNGGEIVVEEDGRWNGSLEDFFTDPDGKGENDINITSIRWGEGVQIGFDSRNFTVTPWRNWNGETWINLTVKDLLWNVSDDDEEAIFPQNGSTTVANITIRVLPVNDPPNLLQIVYPNGTVLKRRVINFGDHTNETVWVVETEEDVEVNFTLLTEDPDGDNLSVSFEWEEGDGGVVNDTGNLNFTFLPHMDSVDGGIGRFVISDLKADLEIWVLFIITPVNDPPVITTPPRWNVTLYPGENTTVDLKEMIKDVDTPFEDLVITVDGPFTSLNSSLLLISVPPQADAGDYTLTITVSDGDGEDSSTLTLHVIRGEAGQKKNGEGTSYLPYIAALILLVAFALVLLLLRKKGEREMEE